MRKAFWIVSYNRMEPREGIPQQTPPVKKLALCNHHCIFKSPTFLVSKMCFLFQIASKVLPIAMTSPTLCMAEPMRASTVENFCKSHSGTWRVSAELPESAPTNAGAEAASVCLVPITDPWDERYIYLHELLILMVHVGKYTSLMDPMGLVILFLRIRIPWDSSPFVTNHLGNELPETHIFAPEKWKLGKWVISFPFWGKGLIFSGFWC